MITGPIRDKKVRVPTGSRNTSRGLKISDDGCSVRDNMKSFTYVYALSHLLKTSHDPILKQGSISSKG